MNRRMLIYICTLLPFTGLVAQQQKNNSSHGKDSLTLVSPATFQLMPLLNPWLTSTNPAGHAFNPKVLPGRMDVNYSLEQGDYKRVQQGEKIQQFSFRTERYKKVERTFFYGSFSYEKSFEKGCKYNLVNNPYRGTPYLLIDTTGRYDTYDREFFSIRGDISTPVFRNLSWGLSADMNVGLSSQDRDPRPRNKVLDLGLSQGLLLSYPHISLGVNMLYNYYNEDIETDIVEQNVQMAFFQLLGFDRYTYHVAASFNRLYKRNTLGGEGQLQLDLGRVNSLFRAKFLYLNESADDGRKAGDASWSYIKNDSELEGNELEISNVSSFRHNNFLHTLQAGYLLRHTLGTEILQRLEQVGEAGAVDWLEYGREEKYASSVSDLQFSYSFLVLKDHFARNMEFRAGLNYQGSEKAYYLPHMQEGFQNRTLSASIRKSFYLSRNEIALGAGMKLKKNLDASRTYDESGFLSEKLLLPDFVYLTSAYHSFSVHLSYALDLDRIFDKYFFSTDLVMYHGNDELKRTVFNFSTGVIF